MVRIKHRSRWYQNRRSSDSAVAGLSGLFPSSKALADFHMISYMRLFQVLSIFNGAHHFYVLLRYVNIIHLNILSLTILPPSRLKCMSYTIDIIFLLRCSNRHGIQYSGI